MEFLDTNVLVYAGSQQAADQQKAGAARDLLRRGPQEFGISLQVHCKSFTVAARARASWQLSHDEALQSSAANGGRSRFWNQRCHCSKRRFSSVIDTGTATTTPPSSLPHASSAARRCIQRTSMPDRSTTACGSKTRFAESAAPPNP